MKKMLRVVLLLLAVMVIAAGAGVEGSPTG